MNDPPGRQHGVDFLSQLSMLLAVVKTTSSRKFANSRLFVIVSATLPGVEAVTLEVEIYLCWALKIRSFFIPPILRLLVRRTVSVNNRAAKNFVWKLTEKP